jgi:hypothetical protein
MTAAISSDDIARTRHWLGEFAKDWIGEVPTKIHKKEPGGLGAAPAFSDEFVGYIGELTCKVDTCMICVDRKHAPRHSLSSESYRLAHKTQSRNRTTKAIRKLRRVAPLEFDVLYMIVMHGLSVEQVAQKLTERSRTRGLDETFDIPSVVILTVSGVEKVSSWW